MADTVFRSAKIHEETTTEKPPQRVEKTSEVVNVDIEPPFTQYEKIHNKPYTVDHFQLGDTWTDKYGGFQKEIDVIEGYLRQRINTGEVQDDTKAVKEHLKKVYKLCNIDKNERVTMQIEKLAAYMEFLNKIDNIKFNQQRYGI